MVRSISFISALGLSYLLSGIVTLQPTSQPQTKKYGLARHQVAMLLLGFPSIALGSIFIIYNKAVNGSDHFATWHAVSLHDSARHFV